jgi:HD-like signal output (HDOD) protein
MHKANNISTINSKKTNLDMLIKSTTGLISLPEIYLKIRELMNDQSSVLDDFAIVVNGDSNLAARVLKIVNSSFYGFPGQISNIARALNFIGIAQLHDLVLSVSAIKAIKLPNDIIDLHNFWQRSIFCGVFAKRIAEIIKLRDCESCFVIGLLHEIGRLALALNYPDEFQQAQQQSTENNLSLYKIESDSFGFHYGQVGQALMKEWKLPVNFQEITGHHPDLLSAQQFITETAIIHLAHLYAYAEETEQQPEQISLLVNPSVWKILDIPAKKIQEIVIETRQLSKEMEQLVLS